MSLNNLQQNPYFMRELRGLALEKGYRGVNEYSDARLYQFMQVEKYIHELNARQASLLFDGETLYWNESSRPMSWPAWSGREGYWSPVFQGLRDIGPIPSGFYEARQDRLYRTVFISGKTRRAGIAVYASSD